MLNIYVYFNFMFVLFLIMVFLSFVLYYLKSMVMMEWMFFSFNSVNVEGLILVDWVSILFISFIFLISSMIVIYSYMYMYDSKFIKRFIYLIILFILSMVVMIISPNVISVMFGWDGLGVVSYCLVIFYQNYSSYNSGMVTILCNRVGDVGLLMCISLLFMKGSWNVWSMYGGDLVVLVMLLIAGITKSAQIPFSIWLPLAMAAPTPVSALVHSSTLVTAGVYLMIRFNSILLGGGSMNSISKSLGFLAVITMFMAGSMALTEYDLKKIIALSTLSQLGLMMVTLSLGLSMIAFYHLLTHAIFKSMLFMCAGIMIHSMSNNQDIRNCGGLIEVVPFTSMSFFVGSMALGGAPFLAGFYSKDLIMEMIYNKEVSLFMLILGLLSLMLTVLYSIRLMYYMFFKNSNFYSFMMLEEVKIMNISMVILVVFSIFIGSMLNWLFFFDLELIFLSGRLKFITLMVCILGVVMGKYGVMFSKMKNLYYLMHYLMSTMFLSYWYKWIYMPVNLMGGQAMKVDSSWEEFMMKDTGKYLILSKKMLMSGLKMYMFLYWFILIIIFFIVMW